MSKSRAYSIRPRFLLTALYVVSGFCTLCMETLWMRVITLVTGNTAAAAALVIGVFFGAAAAGNLVGAWWMKRSWAPLRIYGICELLSGASAAGLFFFAQWLWSRSDVVPQGMLGALGAALMLVALPALLSGVSFPCLAQAFVSGPKERTSNGGRLYGANLLGAASGIAFGGVLLPWYAGVTAAFSVAASIQVAAGVIAWRAGVVSTKPPTISSCTAQTRSAAPSSLWAGEAARWALLTASGVLSLATQTLLIMWARQVWQGSIYVVAGVLTVFIAGLGLGALMVARLAGRGFAPLALLAGSALGCTGLLLAVPVAGAWLVDARLGLYGTQPATMLGWAVAGSLVLTPLTVCLGGVFPLGWAMIRGSENREGPVIGRALAVNKAGSALGAVAGIFFLPGALGLVNGMHAIAAGYWVIAAGAVLAGARKTTWRITLLVAASVVVWCVSVEQPPLGITSADQVVSETTGPYGPVVVVDRSDTGSRQILLNSGQRLSGTRHALGSQHRQSWVPLLFNHSETPVVVSIGSAAGISAAAALELPVQKLYAIELVPQVIDAARTHFAPWNASLFNDPRAKVLAGDGRVVLGDIPGLFDLVVCDLLFPAEDGTANLYTREFFESVKTRLTERGAFCLWLPAYQHDEETLGIVVRTFLEVFPRAMLVRSNLDPLQPVVGLLGSRVPIPASREFLAARLARPQWRAIAARSDFFESADKAWLLFGGDLHAADPNFSAFPVMSDDRPHLTFLGPRSASVAPKIIGMKLLDWMGRRFTRARYPSLSLGSDAEVDAVLAAVRAANYYYAASVAATVVEGDTRTEEIRRRQVGIYLRKAHELSPAGALGPESLAH